MPTLPERTYSPRCRRKRPADSISRSICKSGCVRQPVQPFWVVVRYCDKEVVGRDRRHIELTDGSATVSCRYQTITRGCVL